MLACCVAIADPQPAPNSQLNPICHHCHAGHNRSTSHKCCFSRHPGSSNHLCIAPCQQ